MSAVVVQFPVRDDDRAEPLCAAHDPAWWFEPEMFAKAVEVCRRCQMRGACLAQALQRGERLGVWGGLTPEQRADLPDADVIPLEWPTRARR